MNSQPDQSLDSSIHEKVETLEYSVNELLKLCNKLSEENKTFQANNRLLMLERADLQTKNDKVRNQVEAMVDRLKALEQAS